MIAKNCILGPWTRIPSFLGVSTLSQGQFFALNTFLTFFFVSQLSKSSETCTFVELTSYQMPSHTKERIRLKLPVFQLVSLRYTIRTNTRPFESLQVLKAEKQLRNVFSAKKLSLWQRGTAEKRRQSCSWTQNAVFGDHLCDFSTFLKKWTPKTSRTKRFFTCFSNLKSNVF